jgi:hypothetical protein
MFLDGHESVVQAWPHKLGQVEFGSGEALEVSDIILIKGVVTGGKFHVFFAIRSVV